VRSLDDYSDIVGDQVLSSIYRKARKLSGKHILHINATYQGGGVAELLGSVVVLMNDLGIDVGWRILHGTPDFFAITKKFHNALQGAAINLTEIKKRLYIRANEDFSAFTHIDHDCVVIHDPQPLPLIKYYAKKQPWLWRCHVDLSASNSELWDFLKKFILRYDLMVISSEKYQRADLPVEQRIIHPAIDPLSPKNMEISPDIVSKYLKKFGIPTDKPLITQISRFDRWKDPEGVIEVFKLVKKQFDCRLVLCGSMAADDPEGWGIFRKVERKARELIDSKDVILITSENSILVNALQRASAVIVQKSTREGFGLTVTEALWKGTAVVTSEVGGIPLQVTDGENGFLLKAGDKRGFAEKIILLLKDRQLAEEMGKKGKEVVRRNFLITRILSDWLDLLNDILK
jgi:trehalose synthase